MESPMRGLPERASEQSERRPIDSSRPLRSTKKAISPRWADRFVLSLNACSLLGVFLIPYCKIVFFDFIEQIGLLFEYEQEEYIEPALDYLVNDRRHSRLA